MSAEPLRACGDGGEPPAGVILFGWPLRRVLAAVSEALFVFT
jgi:hypothetical protein